MATKITTLKALRPALREIGYDCWTSVAGGGNGYRIQSSDGQDTIEAGTLKAALLHGNNLLATYKSL